jgi:hypothetical protein
MDHEESGQLVGLHLLSPTSLAWQCLHNSQSSRMKPTQIPHKTSEKLDKKKIRNQQPLWQGVLVNPQNCLASHYSFSKLLQTVDAPSHELQSLLPSEPNDNTHHYEPNCSRNPLRPSSFSSVGRYTIHLLCLTYEKRL